MLASYTKKHTPFFGAVIALSLLGSCFFFMNPFIKTEADRGASMVTPVLAAPQEKKVVVNLTQGTVTLSDTVSPDVVLPIVSQGKPGSYYETIGGVYASDYKLPLHFSSLGHVYMPYSVHVFGQYFIHGIPYYPNGEKVSSTYSGGCVRLADVHAKLVYDFVELGTPIIVTKENENSFLMTPRISEALTSSKMTLLMAAVISLETLDQEVMMTGTDGTHKTRKEFLPKLLTTGNVTIVHTFAESMGEEEYLKLMNAKAKAIGLSSTYFTDIASPVRTTYDDYIRFMNYVSTYKSYLLRVSQTNTL